MHSRQLLLAAFAVSSTAAGPLRQSYPLHHIVREESCGTDALDNTTWTNLGIDDWLSKWTAANVTPATTNNVQALADSFGAPNFFCGLDNFCNAGQPCVPVTLPAWYALVAIQNWNSYMNSVNTAITFASSIVGLTLPGIIADVFPDPVDNVTPLKTMANVFTSVLGLIPLTGEVATAIGSVSKTITFLTGRLTVPPETDKFLAWSDVAGSLATVVSDYQAAVSTSLKATLDAQANDTTNGINTVLKGGSFLGVAQNFTQADLQDVVTDSITRYALGLALQAQDYFILRDFNGKACTTNSDGRLCLQDDGASTFSAWSLVRKDGDSALLADDMAAKLLTTYKMTKEQIMKGPGDCYDNNNKVQLTDPYETGVVVDANADCVFNLLICDFATDTSIYDGVIDMCQKTGYLP